MTSISTQLRECAGRDIFTDAPECAESVRECRETMDAAAENIDAMMAVLKLAIFEVDGFQKRTGIPQFAGWIQDTRAVIARAEGRS